ncbi:hypothetical protein BS47DRAFT_1390673 [Hydnum rufescens UP504]|uniref:Uncharacterized protein n=1 Tax=Hydnum rufescens UP504 TaxID=1448309 RepID=A0A9P6DYX3_9AGAM|nr:hypothetical protein BS47DRAFT_1390673 [Hydnum rufescens UP504]
MNAGLPGQAMKKVQDRERRTSLRYTHAHKRATETMEPTRAHRLGPTRATPGRTKLNPGEHPRKRTAIIVNGKMTPSVRNWKSECCRHGMGKTSTDTNVRPRPADLELTLGGLLRDTPKQRGARPSSPEPAMTSDI